MEVWDRMRHNELRFWREKRLSAIVLVLRECVLEAKAAESARFDRARRDVRTSCEGLLEGQRFDRIAGSEDAACRGLRNGGPPIDS